MKRKTLLLSKLALTLGLGLTLSLTSCKDNDLADGDKTPGGNDSELTDLEWQKQQSLQCLLGAVASLDSLPTNWADASFTATPTIGVAADEATPYSVRLVPTSSADEAYREFCSMTQSSMTSSATNQTWSQEGIGTMRFEVNNTADCYATINVNVQQLPTLQQIRFVPPTIIGDNGDDVDAYYSFGDIVEKTEGEDKTYWVCVRPVDTSLKLKTSHWCTLQLTENNYKTTESKTLVIPTALCKDRSDGERMTQNFFNLLRSMADLSLYDDASVTGIDKFNKNKLPWNQLRTTSYLWDLDNYWSKFMPDQYAEYENQEVKDLFTEPAELDAIYNGYTSKSTLFGLGTTTYKVYNVHLTRNKAEGQPNRTLFNNATPQTRNVKWEKDEGLVDFHNFYQDPSRYINNMEQHQAFIVRYKTGAQLQERLFSTANDYHPQESFKSSAPKAGLTDVLVYNDILKKGQKGTNDNFTPFFTIGDIITQLYNPTANPLDENECHFCVLPAFNSHWITEEEKQSDLAYFISNQPHTTNVGVKVSEKMAKYLAAFIMEVYVSTEYNLSSLDISDDYSNNETYVMRKIKNSLNDHPAIHFEKVGNNNDDYYFSLSLNLYMDDNDLTNGQVTAPHTITCKLYPKHDKGEQYVYTITPAADNEATSVLALYTYEDTHMYSETYSRQRTLMLEKEARKHFASKAYALFSKTQNY